MIKIHSILVVSLFLTTTSVFALPASNAPAPAPIIKQASDPEAAMIQAILKNAEIKASQSLKSKKSGVVAGRVMIKVTGHFPFNGDYTFGSSGLHCDQLLGPGEHFPSGVTCRDVP